MITRSLLVTSVLTMSLLSHYWPPLLITLVDHAIIDHLNANHVIIDHHNVDYFIVDASMQYQLFVQDSDQLFMCWRYLRNGRISMLNLPWN